MSTRRLILVRHAKSSWDNSAMADHDRPLNQRGRDAAQLIGEWLQSRGEVPQEVLCSDALRTRETWDIMQPELVAGAAAAPKLVLKPSLYHAAADVMLAVLRGASEPVVMMIGHNPGIAEFASRLLANPVAAPEFCRYPTCATLVATFETASWAEVGFGTGAAQDFIFPRALER